MEMEKGAATSYPMEMKGSRADHEEGNVGTLRTAETLLRIAPMGICIAALVVMLENSQSNDFGSLSYSDLGAFRFLVHANGICAGYSLLSAIFVAIPRSSALSKAWTFFFLDQVLTYIILAAGAASTAVLYLAKWGDTTVTWSVVCGSFGRFCHKATASVAMTFVVVAFYVVLSLISSYKLFSLYDAPASNPSEGIEVAASHG